MKLELETNVYRADQVMVAKKRTAMQDGLHFADLSFRPCASGTQFGGSGLYACFHRDRLLYIGKYRGKQANWRFGNVIDDRWIKHVSTFTMRARNLGFSRLALSQIDRHLSKGPYLPAVLLEGYRRAERAVLQRETGCMTTCRRFLVAAKLWEEGFENEGPVLEDFSFLYVRQVTDLPVKFVRQIVSSAEDTVLNEIHPPGNTVKNPRETALPSMGDLQDLFARKLEEAAGRAKTLSSLPNKGNVAPKLKQRKPVNQEEKQVADDFKAQINCQDTPKWARKFVCVIERQMEEIESAAIVYAKVPDMRIAKRIRDRKRDLNIVRFKWQPREKRFLMYSLLYSSELQQSGLKFLRTGPDHILCQESLIYQEDFETNLAGILRAIYRACETRADRTRRSLET